MKLASNGLSARQIAERVTTVSGPVPESSIRSYLSLNTPHTFVRESRGVYRLGGNDGAELQRPLFEGPAEKEPFTFGKATLFHANALDWLADQPDNSIHAVVTDPPYGLQEYTAKEQAKLRSGKGGVWRIPPAFDGHRRSPLPRFTTLTDSQKDSLREFFFVWTRLLVAQTRAGRQRRRGFQPDAVRHRLGGLVGRGA